MNDIIKSIVQNKHKGDTIYIEEDLCGGYFVYFTLTWKNKDNESKSLQSCDTVTIDEIREYKIDSILK